MTLTESTLEATAASEERREDPIDDLLERTESVIAWAKEGLERSARRREEADLERGLDVLFGEGS